MSHFRDFGKETAVQRPKKIFIYKRNKVNNFVFLTRLHFFKKNEKPDGNLDQMVSYCTPKPHIYPLTYITAFLYINVSSVIIYSHLSIVCSATLFFRFENGVLKCNKSVETTYKSFKVYCFKNLPFWRYKD